ncbi:MAG: hypothetical protein HN350_13425 [Phycisphaerales bacterium]|nr:hypothetical protein [Phycisphaerales bacterium]
MLKHAIITGLAIMISTGALHAQAKAEAAPAKPVAKPAEKLTVTVVSVSGKVEKCSAADAKPKWTALKAGDTLTELAIIRTGLSGAAVLKMADRGLVTVKNGTKVGIASFRKTKGLVTTRLGLKYGAMHVKVDSSKGKNDLRVRTAVGTLAATGTGGHIAFSGGFSLQAKGTEGSWRVAVDAKIRAMLAGEWANKNLDLPVNTLLQKHGIQLGDVYGGLTIRELQNLLLQNGGRGIIGFSGNAQSSGAPNLIIKPPSSDDHRGDGSGMIDGGGQ